MTSVRVERDGAVVTVTLNRPERRNGITAEAVERLVGALEEVARTPSDRVLVLTGAGGAFCSGMDLSEAVPDPLPFMRRVGAACTLLHDLPIPTIAKVRGPAIGFGCNLALCCDLVVAGSDALFGEIFSERGLSIDGGGSWSLPRLVGLAKAKEILFFGQRIGAEDAAAMGLVNRAVPVEDLDRAVDEWAQRLAAGPRLALSTIKAALNGSHEESFAQAVEREAVAQALSFGSREAREGVRAFIERRPPNFT